MHFANRLERDTVRRNFTVDGLPDDGFASTIDRISRVAEGALRVNPGSVSLLAYS
jgi:hypothetical protein